MQNTGDCASRSARIETALSQGVILALAAAVLALFVFGMDSGPAAPEMTIAPAIEHPAP